MLWIVRVYKGPPKNHVYLSQKTLDLQQTLYLQKKLDLEDSSNQTLDLEETKQKIHFVHTHKTRTKNSHFFTHA